MRLGEGGLTCLNPMVVAWYQRTAPLRYITCLRIHQPAKLVFQRAAVKKIISI